MNESDPLQEIEKIIKQVHDGAGKYTKPVLKRYPLIFAFLLTFSVVAISHGFELYSDEIPLFRNHPTVLMAIGAVTLFLTGTLYKLLEKDRNK